MDKMVDQEDQAVEQVLLSLVMDHLYFHLQEEVLLQVKEMLEVHPTVLFQVMLDKPHQAEAEEQVLLVLVLLGTQVQHQSLM
jgi:hypothetical protein